MIKFLEIRDRGTFIPCFAFRPASGNPSTPEGWLAWQAGFAPDSDCVVFGRLDQPSSSRYDPYDWPSPTRTMMVSHQFITEHFDELNDGDVVDVEFILGETAQKKRSERECL